MTYREALEALFRRRRFGVRPGLDGTRALLAALGNPERGLRAVHIAGTNGKGSTAAFVESMLRAGGLRTGLYTSPHLLRFTERIRVDGVEITEPEAAALAERALFTAPEATFFEIATAMAFSAFAARGVEVAVVEAGLGGRLDATNVLEAPLATVVTGVALDHTELLGPTLVDVAREKAGIWKPGAPALLACDDPAARALLLKSAARVGAPAFLYGREIEATPLGSGLLYRGPGGPLNVPSLGLAGAFQRRNAALALAAVALVGSRGGRAVDAAARLRGLDGARWPARLELLAKDVLLDAAHNPDGARTLAAELPGFAAGRKISLVFGVAQDKDAAEMLAALLPRVASVILTRPPSPRARDPESLRALCPDAEVVPNPGAALDRARARGGLTVVAGSIFLVAEARRLLTFDPENRADPIAVQDPPLVQDPPAQKL